MLKLITSSFSRIHYHRFPSAAADMALPPVANSSSPLLRVLNSLGGLGRRNGNSVGRLFFCSDSGSGDWSDQAVDAEVKSTESGAADEAKAKASSAIVSTYARAEDDLTPRFEQWMACHGKVYKDLQERDKRFRIFKESVNRVEAFNNAGNKSYTLGINQFSDLTEEEFMSSMCGCGRFGFRRDMSEKRKYANVWKQKGAVTPIMNQQQCATEGINKLKTGTLIALSEQEPVDWDTKGGFRQIKGEC